MSYGITQSYLPPDRGSVSRPYPGRIIARSLVVVGSCCWLLDILLVVKAAKMCHIGTFIERYRGVTAVTGLSPWYYRGIPAVPITVQRSNPGITPWTYPPRTCPPMQSYTR